MPHIEIPYRPRAVFLPYHANAKRLGVTVAHRRAGKTVARINRLIKDAATCTKPQPRFGYLAPYYVQAKDIAWLYLKQFTEPFREFGLKVNESELSVTLPHNGALIKLYGAENAERMRGLYFDGIVPDEAQGIPKRVLTQIILPCLADRKGWLDVSGTPKGWDNLLGELVKIARDDPEKWFLQILKASETGLLDEEELARMRSLMPENEYLQEFECDFDAAITGSVYGKWISKMEADGRCKAGLYDPDLPVHTAWDLGFGDATAIWFWQAVRGEVRFIDYYESSGEAIEHYCRVLAERGYKYGDHWAPHDAANKLLAAGGRSVVQIADQNGVRMKVMPATTQMNQIEALRKVLDTAWLDPVTCADGLACLRQYQFKFNDDRQVFMDKPLKDWTSHGVDAAEIVGQVLRIPREEAPKPKPKFFEEMSFNEIMWADGPAATHDRI